MQKVDSAYVSWILVIQLKNCQHTSVSTSVYTESQSCMRLEKREADFPDIMQQKEEETVHGV